MRGDLWRLLQAARFYGILRARAREKYGRGCLREGRIRGGADRAAILLGDRTVLRWAFTQGVFARFFLEIKRLLQIGFKILFFGR